MADQLVQMVGRDATGQQVAVPVLYKDLLGTGAQYAPAIAPAIGADIGASSTGAAAILTATLAGVAGKLTYITGFQITGAGATAAAIVTVTVTGLLGGTQNYKLVIPAGATLGVTPLLVNFARPLPASALNTAIVVTVPSFGAGNTDAAVAAQGFQL